MSGYRRWNHHDYEGWGYYLITFSTEPRRPIFSRIENYKAELTPCGKALEAAVPGVTWDCLGDLALLDYPVLLPIVVSRRADESAIRRTIEGWLEQVQRGAIPIGGFISPGEKEALRAFSQIPHVRVIRMLPYGLKEWKPHGRQLENLAESRLLLLSAFPEEVEGCNWDNCHRNNDLAAAIAAARPRR